MGLCACGKCGRELPPSTSRRPRRFIHGHNPKDGPRKDQGLCDRTGCQEPRLVGGKLCAGCAADWARATAGGPADYARWRRYPGAEYHRRRRKDEER